MDAAAATFVRSCEDPCLGIESFASVRCHRAVACCTGNLVTVLLSRQIHICCADLKPKLHVAGGVVGERVIGFCSEISVYGLDAVAELLYTTAQMPTCCAPDVAVQIIQR